MCLVCIGDVSSLVCVCSSRWQDIVVGAPQFFQRDGEVGGAVYVYINNAGKWSTVVPTRLNGTKDSMFGLAVKNIGDINLDSYEGGRIWDVWIFLCCIHTLLIHKYNNNAKCKGFRLRK